MKVILLDPQKKAEYDLGISNIGGLADTNVITENLNISRQFTDEWFCPNCQLPNPKEALFCQYCSKSVDVYVLIARLITRPKLLFAQSAEIVLNWL